MMVGKRYIDPWNRLDIKTTKREVDSYLRILALNALHLLESLIKSSSSLLQPAENPIPFLLVQLVARLPLLRGVDHQLY